MNLTEYAIKNRAVSYFVAVLIMLGGIGGYFTMGHLEDPIFSIKKAIMITPYPGASPEEVELEVTDRIEKAIQEVPELRNTYSHSYPGLSIIKIDTHQRYWRDKLPQVWDDIRKKIRDKIPEMPPGVGKTDISDDFNFVYGFVLAITGDGFSYKQLEDYADAIKKDLSIVEGVARVELWGVQEKVIYLDVSEAQLAALGLTAENFVTTLRTQNQVVDAGFLEVGKERMRVAPTGKWLNPEEIGDVYLRAYDPEFAGQRPTVTGPYAATPTGPTAARPTPTGPVSSGGGFRNELIAIKDIATVRASYKEPQDDIMRFDGKPSIGIQIAAVDGVNVVEVGERLEARIRELKAQYPVGIEIGKVAWQSDLVTASISAFMNNLIQSVIIVLGLLTVAMGLRMGVVIGTGMILTIALTFVGMSILDMNLQRMSLGALIIAMGMMVDNAIVVAEGAQVKIDQGIDRVKAVTQSAVQPTMSLLGATVIASATFYPVYASDADAGEYCVALFVVVALALSASWFIAITLTPLQCLDLLKPSKKKEGGESRFASLFRASIVACLKFRWIVLAVLGGALVAAIIGFGAVKQMFFPDASRPQFMVDFWYPNGTRIEEVAIDTRRAEAWLLEADEVANISTYIGAGPPRFYLPVDPEMSFTPHYAEIVVNTNSYEDIAPVVARLEPWMTENYPEAVTRVRYFGVGPSETWKLEWRVSGPANADIKVLRDATDQMIQILHDSELAKEVRTDVPNKVKRIVPEYDQERARWSVISREDIARSTRLTFDGQTVGLYREEDDLYPIILRYTDNERRAAVDNIDTLQVQGTMLANSVPLSQVTTDIALDWEEPAIIRWQRRRGISLWASPKDTTYPELKKDVEEKILAIEMPPGYDIHYDGEDESTLDATTSLTPGVIPALAVVLLTLVLLYNAYRPVIIIMLTVPFVFIGITPGLLIADAPFGFVAILGAMSLSGMMIKNIIVLLDEIQLNLDDGQKPHDAIVNAVIARARPVALAAATTVGGVATIAGDVFWSAMAITIMAGLTVGTFLTLYLVPTLYAVFYKVHPDTPSQVTAKSA